MIGKQTCRVSLTGEQARRALEGRRRFPDLGDESSEVIVQLTEAEKAALAGALITKQQHSALTSALTKVEEALDATT